MKYFLFLSSLKIIILLLSVFGISVLVAARAGSSLFMMIIYTISSEVVSTKNKQYDNMIPRGSNKDEDNKTVISLAVQEECASYENVGATVLCCISSIITITLLL